MWSGRLAGGLRSLVPALAGCSRTPATPGLLATRWILAPQQVRSMDHQAVEHHFRNLPAHIPPYLDPHDLYKFSDEEVDQGYIRFFDRCDIDGFDIRNAMMGLLARDLVPEPKVLISALHACRRVNDYALAVRILEAVKWKAAYGEEIWSYLVQEICPTLTELGIDTPEMLGLDKPIYWLDDVDHMH